MALLVLRLLAQQPAPAQPQLLHKPAGIPMPSASGPTIPSTALLWFLVTQPITQLEI